MQDENEIGVTHVVKGTRVRILATRVRKGLWHPYSLDGVLIDDHARIGPCAGWDVYDVLVGENEVSAYGFDMEVIS